MAAPRRLSLDTHRSAISAPHRTDLTVVER
jgi:hypothetical protein